ncbi:uncharacterized protein LOC126846918 [Adelges cooleyi]|uniref:uncharacterized protein LOC126846918 n=1 Tax=Adelges cooleyi TaxID=133065 RepID=UPI00217F48E3|nr:uncharacterized protein LOC126846918 [Adelges cooleyi]
MNHFCFLIPLVFVSVLADNLMTYKEQVSKTNKIIASAEPVMHEVLRKIARENESMEKLVMMFAVPDRADIENDLKKHLEYEAELQKEITAALTPTSYIPSISIPGVNSYIPDVTSYIPSIPKTNFLDTIPVKTMGDTLSSAWSLVGYPLADVQPDSELSKLAEERRLLTSKVPQFLIDTMSSNRVDKDIKNKPMICRLVALAHTMNLWPDPYIIKSTLTGNVCQLTSIEDSVVAVSANIR